MIHKKIYLLFIVSFAILNTLSAQGIQIGLDTTRNVITTAVPFLTISPDARSGGMGEVGVAISPDANSSYWNPAKLVFLDNQVGGTISYTPWLSKLVPDMSIAYLSGYYKIDKEQAVSLSMRYFDLGEIFFTEDGENGTLFDPREYAFSGHYARKLTESFSLSVGMRYIRSNLTGSYTSNTSASVEARPGSSVAADIAVYYIKDILLSGKNTHLAFGTNISNIGRKLTYTDEDNRDFIPTNLRLGTAVTTDLDPFNTITLALDFNKLMVPTPTATSNEKSLLSGMFGSFGDAPGGFSEEIKEVIIAVGAEYWYNSTFAARAGYFSESVDKGNRKYLTLGLGFRYQVFGIDFAYLIPSQQDHPLKETLRFTLHFNMAQEGEEESIIE
jgi:hypothetical protein